MFERFKEIIYKLFLRNSQESDEEQNKSQRDAQAYYDTSKENITAMVGNALSILAFGDSSVTVNLKGTNTKRTKYLNSIAQKEFNKAKRKISTALGIGMIASIPYCVDAGIGKKIYIDTVAKDRFWVTGTQGDDITEVVALADVITYNKKKYMRWTNYSIQNGVYLIQNKATNEQGDEVALTTIPQWTTISPEIAISGVDRLPIAFYSCPTGDRRPDGIEGVPITYGCDAILKKIATTLKDIETEFKRKKVKILLPRSMAITKKDKNGKPIGDMFDDEVYVKLSDSEENKIVVYDPPIRESSYFSLLQQYLSLLEKAIGCSKGILTDMLTQNATATEIRRAMNATFCLTDDMRKEYVRYFEDLMYSVNVLCNYYNITPVSDYNINFDWSYSLLEDSEQTFRQFKDGKAEGAISTLEIRQFLKPDESPDDAQKAIEDIKKNEPGLKTLIGVE